MRDQQKMAIECQNVERMGLNVLSYLQKAYGCISPRATWQRLQLNYLGRTIKTMTDGREKKEMFTRKITLEQKKKAVEMALEGQSPIEYLRECGSVNPNNLWYVIKQNMKKVDPETYERLQAMGGRKAAKPETAVEPMPAAETPESVKMPPVKEPEAEGEEFYSPLEVTAVRDRNLGEFYRDHDHNTIDWRNGMGDEMSMGVHGWIILLNKLPKILHELGVEV